MDLSIACSHKTLIWSISNEPVCVWPRPCTYNAIWSQYAMLSEIFVCCLDLAYPFQENWHGPCRRNLIERYHFLKESVPPPPQTTAQDHKQKRKESLVLFAYSRFRNHTEYIML